MSDTSSATTQDEPRGPPYFADNSLDSRDFLKRLRQPVGGPCAASHPKPTRGNAEEEFNPDDDWADEGSNSNATPAVTTSKPRASNRTLPSGSGKKEYTNVRVAGGRAPIAKKVVWELDSDDEIIVAMKQQNATDHEVANRLISEGRTRYNYKTISSRWIRLRNVLAKREDELLDEDLTDWHEGEDELLLDAYDIADEQVLQELEKIRGKRWLYVAQQLRNLKPSSRYSQFACKDRYEALEAGTARIPPELDDDPAARVREREEKKAAKAQAEAEKAREKAAAEEKARIEAEQAAIQAEESRKAKAEAKARLEEEKAEAAYAAAASKVAKEQSRIEAARAKEEAAVQAKIEQAAKAAAAEKEKELALAMRKAEREEKALRAKAFREEKAEKALRAKAEKEELALRAKAEKEEKARRAKAEKLVREKAEKEEREAQAKAAKEAKAKAALQSALEKAAQAKLNLQVKTSHPAGAKPHVKAQKRPDTKVGSAKGPVHGTKRKAQGGVVVKDQPVKKKHKPTNALAAAPEDPGEIPAPGQSQNLDPAPKPNVTSVASADRPVLAGGGVQRAVAVEPKISKVGLGAPPGAPRGPGSTPVSAPAATPQSTTLVPSPPSATTTMATPSDPRGVLSISELSKVLKDRGLKQSGKKSELFKRIADHDAQLSVNELKEKLRNQKIKTSGTKQELIQRLVLADVQASAAYQKGDTKVVSMVDELKRKQAAPIAKAPGGLPSVGISQDGEGQGRK